MRVKHCEAVLYQEDGHTSKTIKAEIEKRSVDKYVIVFHDRDIKEDGTPDKPHFHVYLHFANGASWPLDTVAKWFSAGAHLVSPIKADTYGNGKKAMYNVMRYYTHCDYPDKAQYDPSNFVANFSVDKYLAENAIKYAAKDAAKNKLDIILDMCAKGEITKANLNEYMAPDYYASNRSKIDAVLGDYHTAVFLGENGNNRLLKTIYVFGDSGVGKTTVCQLYCNEVGKEPYISSAGRNYADEYTGQEVIIMDDIRANNIEFIELIRLIDPYTNSALKARYHNKVNMSDTIFLTSIYAPQKLTESYCLTGEDPAQFYRRLSEVWEVTQEYILMYTITNYGHMVFKGRTINPLRDYLASLPPQIDTVADSMRILEAVSKKYSRTEEAFEQTTLF